MAKHVVSINPCISHLSSHDPSAVLFEDGELVFGVEEERFVREKHAAQTFPMQSIEKCLDYAGVGLSDVDKILVPWEPRLFPRMFPYNIKQAVTQPDKIVKKVNQVEWSMKHAVVPMLTSKRDIRERLEELSDSVPPIETYEHHRCHAASAFYPSEFDEALVVTLDARGEYDCTVIWHATQSGLERIHTYEYPNSLGFFYGAVTNFLGYYPNNGEGKIMGLAPYGTRDSEIERTLKEHIDIGLEYDVTSLSKGNFEYATKRLEELFGRSRKETTDSFTQWEKDLAHVTQRLLEDTVTEIVDHYSRKLQLDTVCLAGGIALNCKMNKEVMEMDAVDEIFIQPVSNDAGSAIGAGFIEAGSAATEPMSTVYWGPSYNSGRIEEVVETNKIAYQKPDDLAKRVADLLAEGNLVGWFQGRLEMGPRALGNRSILADPRSEESLDRVNKYVKHREEWRPFAPSMLEEAAEEYLVNAEKSPYMIKTFDLQDGKEEEIPAVIHPADDTTRPQTVREDQNPKYYRLIKRFEERTGVPVVLNTSFNDHGEPIVNKPVEAVRDFYGMGLDVLVLEDMLIEKQPSTADSKRSSVPEAGDSTAALE